MSLRGLLLLAALIALAACSGDNGGDGGPGPVEPPTGDIEVRNDFFDPAELEVAPGATVVWAWVSGSRVHNVTFADGEDSGDRSSGTFERTFEAAGTYPYHCTIHGSPTSGMRGVVTVDDGDDGPGPVEPPEGDVEVRNDLFDPAELEVAPGATVVWAWASGGRVHNVTFADGEESGNRSSGTFERTFEAAGTYPYHCTIHGSPTSGMRGVVTVAGGGASTGDESPQGY